MLALYFPMQGALCVWDVSAVQAASCRGVLTASCSLSVSTLPLPLSSSPSALRGSAMGVLIALELGSGTGVRPSTDSAKELD